MSNVIQLLERIGQCADLRHAPAGELDQVLISADIAPDLQAAIIAKDGVKLGALLGQSPVCAMFFPAEEEGEEEGEEEPSEEPDEKALLDGLVSAA